MYDDESDAFTSDLQLMTWYWLGEHVSHPVCCVNKLPLLPCHRVRGSGTPRRCPWIDLLGRQGAVN